MHGDGDRQLFTMPVRMGDSVAATLGRKGSILQLQPSAIVNQYMPVGGQNADGLSDTRRADANGLACVLQRYPWLLHPAACQKQKVQPSGSAAVLLKDAFQHGCAQNR